MDEKLNEIRDDIDAVDRKIMRLLEGRVNLAKEAGAIKKRDGLSVSDPAREKQVLENVKKATTMKPEFVESLYKLIIDYCKNEEQK